MKTLLTALALSFALTACGDYTYESEMFPGAEAEMIAMCAANGGFDRGQARAADQYSTSRYPQIIAYRTTYKVQCKNGARIDKTYSRPVPR